MYPYAAIGTSLHTRKLNYLPYSCRSRPSCGRLRDVEHFTRRCPLRNHNQTVTHNTGSYPRLSGRYFHSQSHWLSALSSVKARLRNLCVLPRGLSQCDITHLSVGPIYPANLQGQHRSELRPLYVVGGILMMAL